MEEVSSRDSRRGIHGRAQVPERPWGVAVLVHGLAEHSGRYAQTMADLAARGLACYVPDLHGHGLSPGRRVDVASFDDFLQDVDAAEAVARARHPSLPVGLVGHSMGGLVALLHALRRPQGRPAVAVTSPLLGLHPGSRPSPARRALAKVLYRIAPGLPLPSGLDPTLVSRDPVVVAAYVRDPLVSRRVSARWFRSMQSAAAEVMRGAPRLVVPTLVMAAGADRVVDPEAIRRFAAAAPPGRLEYVEWPRLYHEILNEPERAAVVARLADWLEARMRGDAGTVPAPS
jgi:alpha-beta hydrolase superfamily lysophospholipase